jgi:hypothetical protein
MGRVSDVPTEIWTLIFGYLNLEDLVDVESACKALWARITQRVATNVISGIIAHGKLVADAVIDCPGLPAKEGRQRWRKGLKPLPSFICSYHPLYNRCAAHAFQRKDHTTQLTLKLESPFRAVPNHAHPKDFHPCRNGPEPIEIMLVTADFTSSHLPKDLCGTLRLQHSTVGMSICNQLDDVHIDEERCSRTISHFLSWCRLGWNTTGMCQDEFLDLPKEWAGFLQGQVDAMIQFERNPESIHFEQVGGRTIECIPFVLKDFKATWTFLSVPGSIEQVVEDNSEDRLESDDSENQVQRNRHRAV